MDSTSSVCVRVCEIFHSIQGESTTAGLPCVFVRLSGCNLRCTYCDTTYAYAPGAAMSVGEVLSRIGEFGTRTVEVTGGEPLLQPECPALLAELVRCGYEVLLETNGSLALPADRRYRVIMDVKCPSSGESDNIDRGNFARLQAGDEVKFVIGSRADFDWAVSAVAERELAQSDCPVLFSPLWGQVSPADLARWILDSGLPVRLQLQLHKIIWPDRDRGV